MISHLCLPCHELNGGRMSLKGKCEQRCYKVEQYNISLASITLIIANTGGKVGSQHWWLYGIEWVFFLQFGSLSHFLNVSTFSAQEFVLDTHLSKWSHAILKPKWRAHSIIKCCYGIEFYECCYEKKKTQYRANTTDCNFEN